MGNIDTPQAQYGNLLFRKAAMKMPLLDAQTEAKLSRLWRDNKDEGALRRLVTPYLRLVISIASRFRNYGLPVGDLVQEGNVGLMQAAARFDPEREVRFSTYASWWIRASIQDFILRNWSIVRTGTTTAQKSLFFNLRRLAANINQTGSGYLKEEHKLEIAEQLGVKVREITKMEGRLSSGDKSLNTPVGESGENEWQDLMAVDQPNPEEIISQQSEAAAYSRWIATAIDELNPREQKIIRERRLSDNGLTLEALGNQLGISKERVRQIEEGALNKLKSSILKQVKNPLELTLLLC